MGKRARWTQVEIKILVDNYRTMTIQELAVLLDKSRWSIKGKLGHLARTGFRKKVTKCCCGLLTRHHFNDISKKAKKRGLDFHITPDYLWQLFQEQGGKCAFSGIDLILDPLESPDGYKTASVDRIDSTKGYVFGNVQWVHKSVNMMKRSMADDKFRQWCRMIADYSR